MSVKIAETFELLFDKNNKDIQKNNKDHTKSVKSEYRRFISYV